MSFQDEVIERAKKAKEKAARDSKEVQGPVSSSVISPKIEVFSSPTSSSPDADSESVVNQDPSLGE